MFGLQFKFWKVIHIESFDIETVVANRAEWTCFCDFSLFIKEEVKEFFNISATSEPYLHILYHIDQLLRWVSLEKLLLTLSL